MSDAISYSMSLIQYLTACLWCNTLQHVFDTIPYSMSLMQYLTACLWCNTLQHVFDAIPYSMSLMQYLSEETLERNYVNTFINDAFFSFRALIQMRVHLQWSGQVIMQVWFFIYVYYREKYLNTYRVCEIVSPVRYDQ